MFEASAEALCKGTEVEELVKVFDRSSTLLGTFINVDKALKDNFLGIMLEIYKLVSRTGLASLILVFLLEAHSDKRAPLNYGR